MDLLSDILSLLELRGTLYFRTDFSPPWGVRVPAFENVARFHAAFRGRCWLRVAGVEAPIVLEQGDLAIVTHGAEHVIADPEDAPVEIVDRVVAEAGFEGRGALVYGGTSQGHETQLVCGHFAFDRDAAHPLIDALPPVIHLRADGTSMPHWLEANLRLIGAEAGRDHFGGDLIALKLAEIIFAQAIRAYLAAEGERQIVFKGLAHPQISRALQALHGDPAADWTIDDMARVAGMSRTGFSTRFQALMGTTPMLYLTQWRMQVARRLLTDSDRPMIAVAEAGGYGSEAAFGRVFKRHFGLGPATYRRQRREEAARA